MKGLFIPEITAEMFRNGCLESIETLIAEGQIYDIEYSRWIPISERLPENESRVLVTIQTPTRSKVRSGMFDNERFYNDNGDTWKATDKEVKAWMPLPGPYKAESEVQNADCD